MTVDHVIIKVKSSEQYEIDKCGKKIIMMKKFPMILLCPRKRRGSKNPSCSKNLTVQNHKEQDVLAYKENRTPVTTRREGC